MSQNALLDRPIDFQVPPRVAPRPVPYAAAKRVLDVAVSGALLLVLAPLFLIIAAAVRATSRGPILYRSTRVGLGGREFPFVKFRSMHVDADSTLLYLHARNEKDGPIFKMKADPRVTPIGRFLRKYSLDELPQIVSVFLGDMSLVGPRPPLPREVDQYDAYAMERLSVKPGLTCYWQVMGRSDLDFHQWIELDHRYLRDMSLQTDLRLLLRTPMAVFRGRGAY